MLSDDEVLQFATFVIDRFVGAAPEEKLLVHALGDFKARLARRMVDSAHTDTGHVSEQGVQHVGGVGAV